MPLYSSSDVASTTIARVSQLHRQVVTRPGERSLASLLRTAIAKRGGYLTVTTDTADERSLLSMSGIKHVCDFHRGETHFFKPGPLPRDLQERGIDLDDGSDSDPVFDRDGELMLDPVEQLVRNALSDETGVI